MRACYILSNQLCEACATQQGSLGLIDVERKENAIIDNGLRKKSHAEATLHSTLPPGDILFLEVAGSSDALGIVVEALLPMKPVVEQLSKSFELDAKYVVLEVVSITPGGKVDVHNSQQQSTKMRPKDLVVEVGGATAYTEAKHKLKKSTAGTVSFAVMSRSGLELLDLREELGSLQPRPANGMHSPQWNTSRAKFRCAHPGCKAVLKLWCDVCVKQFQFESGAKRVFHMIPCVHYNGWWVSRNAETIKGVVMHCPQHSVGYNDSRSMPSFDPEVAKTKYKPCAEYRRGNVDLWMRERDLGAWQLKEQEEQNSEKALKTESDEGKSKEATEPSVVDPRRAKAARRTLPRLASVNTLDAQATGRMAYVLDWVLAGAFGTRHCETTPSD